MVRIRNEMARALAVLAAALEAAGVDTLSVARQILEHADEGIRMAAQAWYNDENREQVIDLKELLGAIEGSQDGYQDGAVLHELEEVLHQPHARSVLGGDTLDRLRRSLVDPRELATLQQKIRAQELHCSSCGRQLQTGQLLVLSDRGQLVGIRCLPCAQRAGAQLTTACGTQGCNHPAPLPAKIRALLGKDFLCSKHPEARQRGAEPDEAPQQTPPNPMHNWALENPPVPDWVTMPQPPRRPR